MNYFVWIIRRQSPIVPWLSRYSAPWVACEPVIKPIIVGSEADQHPGRLSVAGDDDLLALGFAQKPREIVLDLGIAEPASG